MLSAECMLFLEATNASVVLYGNNNRHHLISDLEAILTRQSYYRTKEMPM